MLGNGGAGLVIAQRGGSYAENTRKEGEFRLSRTQAPQVLDLRASCVNRGDGTPVELLVQGFRPRTIGIKGWLALSPIGRPTRADLSTRSLLTTTNRPEAEPVRAIRG
jgi:hypothetical protein